MMWVPRSRTACLSHAGIADFFHGWDFGPRTGRDLVRGRGLFICASMSLCVRAYVPRRMYADVRICIRTDVPVIYTGKPAPVSHELFRLSLAHTFSESSAVTSPRFRFPSMGHTPLRCKKPPDGLRDPPRYYSSEPSGLRGRKGTGLTVDRSICLRA